MSTPFRVELDPGPEAELDRLEHGKRWDLLDNIDEAITSLASDPGRAHHASAPSLAALSGSPSARAMTTG
jgi:hypothetical protein